MYRKVVPKKIIKLLNHVSKYILFPAKVTLQYTTIHWNNKPGSSNANYSNDLFYTLGQWAKYLCQIRWKNTAPRLKVSEILSFVTINYDHWTTGPVLSIYIGLNNNILNSYVPQSSATVWSSMWFWENYLVTESRVKIYIIPSERMLLYNTPQCNEAYLHLGTKESSTLTNSARNLGSDWLSGWRFSALLN